MSVKFECPYCACRLSAEPDLFGKGISCPDCSQPFMVPRPEELGPTPVSKEEVRFICPHCSRKLSAVRHQFGTEMPCPHDDCSKPVLVPSPEWKPISASLLETGNIDPKELIARAEELNRKTTAQ